MADRAYLERLSRELTDQGKLIEAGWIGLRLMAISPDAPPTQLTEMRMAFFAGAQHLFSSIVTIMEAGEEPTQKDLDRMSQINDELAIFAAQLEAKINRGRQ